MEALPPDPKGWSAEEVRQWAMEVVGIKAEHADKLVLQEIDGEELIHLSEAKLERCGIPIGPSGKLMRAIEGRGGGGSSAAAAGDRGLAETGGVSEVVKELRLLRVEQQRQRTQIKVPVRFWAHRRGDPVYAFTVGTFADLHAAVEAKIFSRFGAPTVALSGGGGEGGGSGKSDSADTIDDYRFYYLADRAEGIDSRSELKDEATFEQFALLYNLPTVFLYRRTPSAESPIENPQHMERDNSSVHSSSDAEGSTRGNEQARFREFLEERDGYQCVVTGKMKVRNSNNVVAAHVVGVKCSVDDRKAAGVYKQEYANVNGMLLDAKWHAAFDSYLWCPDRDAVIHLSSEIMDNDEYAEFRPFAGKSLRFQEPLRPSQPRPTPDVLAHRFDMYVRACERAGRDPN